MHKLDLSLEVPTWNFHCLPSLYHKLNIQTSNSDSLSDSTSNLKPDLPTYVLVSVNGSGIIPSAMEAKTSGVISDFSFHISSWFNNNPHSSVLKIYSDFNHFSPSPWLPPCFQPSSSLAGLLEYLPNLFPYFFVWFSHFTLVFSTSLLRWSFQYVSHIMSFVSSEPIVAFHLSGNRS